MRRPEIAEARRAASGAAWDRATTEVGLSATREDCAQAARLAAIRAKAKQRPILPGRLASLPSLASRRLPPMMAHEDRFLLRQDMAYPPLAIRWVVRGERCPQG